MPFTELYFIKLNLSHKAKTTGFFFYIKNLKVKVFYITICNVKNRGFGFVTCMQTRGNLIRFYIDDKNFIAIFFLYISNALWQCYQDNWYTVFEK